MNARERAGQKRSKEKGLVETWWNVYVYNLADWANEIPILAADEPQRSIVVALRW